MSTHLMLRVAVYIISVLFQSFSFLGRISAAGFISLSHERQSFQTWLWTCQLLIGVVASCLRHINWVDSHSLLSTSWCSARLPLAGLRLCQLENLFPVWPLPNLWLSYRSRSYIYPFYSIGYLFGPRYIRWDYKEGVSYRDSRANFAYSTYITYAEEEDEVAARARNPLGLGFRRPLSKGK
jgi:hypothetical protein